MGMEFIVFGPAYALQGTAAAFLGTATPTGWIGAVPGRSFPPAIKHTSPDQVVDRTGSNEMAGVTMRDEVWVHHHIFWGRLHAG